MKEKEKQIFDDTITQKNKEATKSQTKIDIVSTASPKTSMTPISTKTPWDSFLFKLIYELETILDTFPSLTNYYFNSQTKYVVRRTKKIKHDPLEIVSEISWQAQGDEKEKAQESSQTLGSFVNYNQYHLKELAASYDSSLQKIKMLEKQLEKNKLFNEENWKKYSATFIQDFTVERENLNNHFQVELKELNSSHEQHIQEQR